ncbi:hypothetical protein EYU44_18045 [Vibrio cholerae]|nr:hypothetical protein [Vibrio cholerae]
MPFLKMSSFLNFKFILTALLVLLAGYQHIKLLQISSELKVRTVELNSEKAKMAVAEEFNESMNSTIQSLHQQLIDYQNANDWVESFNAAMAANLEKAKDDIGKLIDEATPSSTCSGTYSPDVYQRMLQFYGAGTEGDNSG